MKCKLANACICVCMHVCVQFNPFYKGINKCNVNPKCVCVCVCMYVSMCMRLNMSMSVCVCSHFNPLYKRMDK